MVFQKKRTAGFTLVEMLIALVLMSLLTLGMVSVMRTMGQTQDRIDQRFEHTEEFQAVTAFTRGILSRLSDRRMGLQELGKSPFMFNGQPHSIEWLGIMPARHGIGGRYFFRLSVEVVGATPALVIRYKPWGGEVAFPDWGSAQSRVLVSDLTNFRVHYGGAELLPNQWEPLWASTDDLPVRIRLDIATRDKVWPLWIVATQRFSPGGGRASMYSTGPGK